MIVGHGPLAFALVGGIAFAVGLDRRRALLIGVLAGLFAIVPDVDVAYAAIGGLGSLSGGVWVANEAFWEHASVVHRGITHSLVLGVPAATAFGLAASRRRQLRLGGGLVMLGLLGLSFVVAGSLGFAMMLLYGAAGLGVAALATWWEISPRAVLAAAFVGLLLHPLGDLFTGTPPVFLYPLDSYLLRDHVVLAADPTVHLLSVFALELASLWLGVSVAAVLLRVRVRDYIDPQALVGAGYGLGALLLPAPTLEVSYHFVFSIVAVGGVGVPTLRSQVTSRTLACGCLTGLTAVTLAILSYAAGYSLV